MAAILSRPQCVNVEPGPWYHMQCGHRLATTMYFLGSTLSHLQSPGLIQYIPRNMHTVFALLCFVVVIHWLIFPYPSGLLHWHCGNLTIAPVPAKQPWWIWINTSCELIMNDCITTTKQSTTKPCAYFLGYTVQSGGLIYHIHKTYNVVSNRCKSTVNSLWPSEAIRHHRTLSTYI